MEIKENDLSHLYISKSKIEEAGNGVYSKINIPKGSIVEKACVSKIRSKGTKNSELHDYVFSNPYKTDEYLVAFGYGSMYNHSDDPNLHYYYDQDQNRIIYEAIKDIKIGDELYISYGTNWWTHRSKKKEEPNIIQMPKKSATKYKIPKY
jgi:SET domain-containing protein